MRKVGLFLPLLLCLGACSPLTSGWKEAEISAHYYGVQGTDYVFTVEYENTGMSDLRLNSKHGEFLKVQVLNEKKDNEIVYTTVGKTTGGKGGKRKERIIPPNSSSSFEVRIDKKDLNPGVYNVDLLLEEKLDKYTGVSLWNVKLK